MATAAEREDVHGVDQLLGDIDPQVGGILDKALAGGEVTADEGARLFHARGLDLMATTLAADELRRRTVGDTVTYVVNRNINFTNVCIKRCGFCAFSRGHRDEEGYLLPIEEVVRRAKEAWDLGATEVCIQAGLPPGMDGNLYVEICEAIKRDIPAIHIHGFSPEEVLYGSIRSRCTIREYLQRLKNAGVGSLPGTSAEILDEEIRKRISPGRITVKQWIEVITTAHDLGIPTTATIMYGHVETVEHRARHIDLLRRIQRQTGGFTEFVPLSLIHTEAPMYSKRLVQGVQPGATGDEVIAMYAVSRLMLNNHIKNLQVSWVKEGLKLSQACLNAGANDFGGTLINESISTSAGASYGQLVKPGEFRRVIRDAGRVPAERSTTYKLLRTFNGKDEPADVLDAVDAPEERFGSYQRLVKMSTYRFKNGAQPRKEAPAPTA
ncbi:MAG: 5-amino-6-(D-ribitylamino)uracil--L-tyrosine 4-hydroxyphenyl transferase CofH [Dehalococcoidia bacterium]|nr:5-amino-6-(D-ribitylamino)uracil--L-tyrosine 4-hydroxyphenyl transferase CofH [Dehalococcoidia bacterium]